MNSSLNIHKDIENIRISASERQETYVRGTIQDSERIRDFIDRKSSDKAGKLEKNTRFDSKYWFEVRNDTPNVGRPSDKLEEAFSSVGDYYLANQTAWDGAEEVEVASDDEVEQETQELVE